MIQFRQLGEEIQFVCSLAINYMDPMAPVRPSRLAVRHVRSDGYLCGLGARPLGPSQGPVVFYVVCH